ncbi:MAG: glycerate 2-kinase [Pseudonocardiales bacterium]|nr:glycerate 2-kinase [Pseudonocardiales bacterium]
MRVLACPDKFRGSLSAGEVAAAIAAAAAQVGASCVRLPLADGGEGTLDAFGGANRTSRVTGPLGAPVEAAWRLQPDGLAVVEAAQACGLDVAGGPERNDALRATTRGVGELLAAAAEAGAERVLLGVGGSATTDGGAGAIEALATAGVRIGADLEVTVCYDVRTPFTAAAARFAPQKGATQAQVRDLAYRLRRMRDRIEAETGIDLDRLPGSGAAGGLAGGLAAVGARLVSGFDAIADTTGLDGAIAEADVIVTGEGRIDATSAEGKVVGGVIARASAVGIPALAVCGSAAVAIGVRIVDLTARFGAERAWQEPAECIRVGVVEQLRRWPWAVT